MPDGAEDPGPVGNLKERAWAPQKPAEIGRQVLEEFITRYLINWILDLFAHYG